MSRRASLEIERFPLAKLVEDDDNPRVHSAKNLEAIKASLALFGQVEPLVVQAKGLRVIGGNGRLRAMRDLGWEEADVVLARVPDSKARALSIALNRSSELATWNEATLVKLLDQISGEFPHEALGFTLDDLDFGKMLDPENSKTETDLVEPTPDPLVSFSFGEFAGKIDREVYALFVKRIHAAHARTGSADLATALREVFA